jgi:hypothetical protein
MTADFVAYPSRKEREDDARASHKTCDGRG